MRAVREMLLRNPEVRAVLTQTGPDEIGSEAAGVESPRVLVLLHPAKDWPAAPGSDRPGTRQGLMDDMRAELSRTLPGTDWDFLPEGVDDFQTAFAAVPGAGLLKISGPDLDGLEKLAGRAREELQKIQGVEGVRVRHVAGRAHLDLLVDRDKCLRWGVSAADVNDAIALASGGLRATKMIEGEKIFDIALLWPAAQRRGEEAVLDLPVDVVNNAVVPAAPAHMLPVGPAPIAAAPRIRLRDLVSPRGADRHADPNGRFVRPVAAAIWRENGRRLIAVRFRIRDRDEADLLAEARTKLAPLFAGPYRADWSAAGR
jgi:cobalt-zinc-cadmium resistance protein CzcA